MYACLKALVMGAALVAGGCGAGQQAVQRATQTLDDAETTIREALEAKEERRARVSRDLLCSSSLEALYDSYAEHPEQWDSLMLLCFGSRDALSRPPVPEAEPE